MWRSSFVSITWALPCSQSHLNCRCCYGVKNDSLYFNKSTRALSYVNPATLFLLPKLAPGHPCRAIPKVKTSLASIWECCVSAETVFVSFLNRALLKQPWIALWLTRKRPFPWRHPGGSFCSISPDRWHSPVLVSSVRALCKGCDKARYAGHTYTIVLRLLVP